METYVVEPVHNQRGEEGTQESINGNPSILMIEHRPSWQPVLPMCLSIVVLVCWTTYLENAHKKECNSRTVEKREESEIHLPSTQKHPLHRGVGILRRLI